jgi:hypothetical protein
MACIALFATQPLAMATTQLTRVIQHEHVFTWQMQARVERNPLRMSWAVVADNEGHGDSGCNGPVRQKDC